MLAGYIVIYFELCASYHYTHELAMN